MFYYLMPDHQALVSLMGVIFVFAATCAAHKLLMPRLPKDGGRAFAVEGALSAGKPRGSGILFVLTFTIGVLLFAKVRLEVVWYLILVILEMLTGFLDDASDKPWGELKKGILDLAVSFAAAIVYIHYNGTTIQLPILGTQVTLPPVVYCILAVILIWAAINVANCADGVDGLSATLTIITLAGLYAVAKLTRADLPFSVTYVYFAVALIAYLWFNATPSLVLMGDAGSRAMGIFLAIAAMKTGAPLLFVPFAIVMIIDGGLGLFKVAFIRVTKIQIMKKIRTPLHDHTRKVSGWSGAQTVFRFAVIQVMVVMVVLYLIALR